MGSVKKTRGKPFVKGGPGGPGRPRGSANKATREIRDLCQGLLERPGYQAKFLKAWDARKLPPRLEEMVWHYAHGKPQQNIEIDTGDQLAEAMRLTFERYRDVRR